MSDDTKFTDSELHAQLERDALKERKRKEILEKELKIRERKADSTIQQIEQGDRDSEIAKKTDYSMPTEEDVLQRQKDNTAYMLAARNKMPFINKNFDKAIPFFRKNLILVAGKTGEGKSTAVANITKEMIGTVDSVTKKMRKILILTNEEKAEDVYNRITCLIKGWHYVNHDQFTDEQIKVFNEYIGHLSKLVTVVDDSYHGANGTTTTLEGISQVFDNLIANEVWYDAVLIDYYQNIKESRDHVSLDEWKVQAKLVRKLDTYKNIYPAPIIVLAQAEPPAEENPRPFKYRIEGRKSILNVSTCAVEMVVNKEELKTEWLIHKSRFNQMVGEKVNTGYYNGRYVSPENPAYVEMIQKMKAARATADADSAIGPMKIPKEGEEDE